MRGSRVLLVLLAAAALANLAFAGARRIAYPYDLEWMEGGVLCHALRLVHGEPIYAEPSARFVSFAYTPLYPAVLWALSPVFGLGYLPARSVSVAAFAWALVVAYLFVRREGGSRAVALGAAALPAAAFAPTGAWYDLVRVDSLFLGLLASAVAVGWWTRNGARGPVAAGALMTAAFFAKQTALPFAVVLGLVLLVSRRRAAAVYAATVVMLGAALLAWLHAASGGWFWTYAFALHRRHPFEVAAAALVTPARLALLLAPGLLLLAWALARAPRSGLLYASALAVTGVVAAALGAGTEWSYHNALIPGVYFVSMAIGVAATELEGRPAAPLLLAATVATAPGGLVALAQRVLPERSAASLALPLGYDLRGLVPSAADRTRGAALVARLTAAPGEVFVPDHSFYPHLAGKDTRLHAMNLADLQGAGMKVPRDLVEEVRQRRFSLIVVDREEPARGADPSGRQGPEDEAIGLLPGVSKHYRLAERIDGPRVFSGGRFVPCCLLVPRDEP